MGREQGFYFFTSPTSYDPKNTKKAWKEDTHLLMTELIEVIQGIENFKANIIAEKVKSWITAKEIGFGKIMQPYRISLVGSLQGADLFEISEAIGKHETIARIKKANETLR